MNIRKGLHLIFTLIISVFVASCTEAPREPLRIASSPWPGYEPGCATDRRPYAFVSPATWRDGVFLA